MRFAEPQYFQVVVRNMIPSPHCIKEEYCLLVASKQKGREYTPASSKEGRQCLVVSKWKEISSLSCWNGKTSLLVVSNAAQYDEELEEYGDIVFSKFRIKKLHI